MSNAAIQIVPEEPAAAAPSEAQTAVGDPLLECLLLVVRAHGQRLSRDAVLAGLPVDRRGLLPSLFARAAARAGMSSNILRCPLERINRDLLPAILLLDNGGACVLTGFSEDGQRVRVIHPELGEAASEVAVDQLAGRYSGRVIYVRPRFRFDARAPAVRPYQGQHWFWGVVWESRPLYRDVMVAAALINLFALAMPLFILNVYDRVVPNHALETLWVLVAGIAIVQLGEVGLRMLRGHFVNLAASRIDIKLSASIMERVLGMRFEHRPRSVGSFASNLRAFESVRDFISSSTVVAFIDLPFALIFIIVIGLIAWPVLPVFAIAVAGLLFYAWIVQGRLHELAEVASRASAQRNATLVEGLVGLETIKSMGVEGAVQRRWEEGATLLANTSARLRTLSASASYVAMWVQHVVTVAVVIIGVYLVTENFMSAGGLFACYLLSARAMAPFGQVAALMVQYNHAATALEALNSVMALEVERPQGANFVSRNRLQGDIEFRNVSFAYPEASTAVVSNVSLRIRPGERVALIGRVGSGKTTLEKLVLGLYRPAEGAVLVDGIDIRQLDPAELRRNIGYVPQDVTLFFGSLRENLTLAAPDVDDERIVEAARIAGMLDFVNRHPEGFEMQVGERGEGLSGGQRQQVAIARAILHDPPILLLDEPTASMDQGTENDIKRRLGEFSAGRTLVVVTHRTSLLELVDRVVVLDSGRIVADGPKAEVIEALRQGRVGRAE